MFAHVQHEFDAFIEELHEYYDIKKQLLESKANSAIKSYERSLLKIRYLQVKRRFQETKHRWTLITKQYA